MRAWSVRWEPATRSGFLACWRLRIGRRSPKWCTSLRGVALVLRQHGIPAHEVEVRLTVRPADRARP